MATTYSPEIKDAAKLMYLRRCSVRNIKDELNLNSERVVYQWAKAGEWENLVSHETVEQATSRKIIALVEKPNKTDADYRELTKLGNLLEQMAGVEIKKARAVKERALAARAENGSSENKKKNSKIKNDLSQVTAEELEAVRKELFFDYQQNWYDHLVERIRFILKSRQIGATYYFAWEALENAILTGDNQIFLSASKNQAELFKAYIMHFGREYFGVELKGADVIDINTHKGRAELRFVSTSARSAQSYHGHLYIDEVFWIPGFEKLNQVASAMASHKKWRKTYFSTPSVTTHGAYPLWCGDKYNEDRKKKHDFDLTHKTLAKGHKGKDGIWRNVVTVEDAQRMGCDLFDIDQLRNEYSKAEFNNLFMCAFLEAGLSVFDLSKLLECAIDSNVVWADFKTKTVRPFGNNPVWLGYDPARIGDQSSVCVVAPPLKPGGKFRILEKIKLKGAFSYQAARIEELTQKYNVQFIGVDCTGVGLGVFEQIKAFYPRVTAIHYGMETKTNLVLKALDVVDAARIEWDAEHTDIAQAFLQVRQTTTGNDRITYVADRTSKTGHADIAWAVMHALSNEPLSGKRRKATVSFAS